MLKVEYLTGYLGHYNPTSTEYLVTKAVGLNGVAYNACEYVSDIKSEHIKGFKKLPDNDVIYTPSELGSCCVMRNTYIGNIELTGTTSSPGMPWFQVTGTNENSMKQKFLVDNKYISADTALADTVQKDEFKTNTTTITATTSQSHSIPSSAVAADRCENIDISNSRIGKLNDAKEFEGYGNASLILSLENVKSFNASNCNLLTATIDVGCQALSTLKMEYNRFGAISNGAAKGRIVIGTNVWRTQSYFDMLAPEYDTYATYDPDYDSGEGSSSSASTPFMTTSDDPDIDSIPDYILGLDNGRQGYAQPVVAKFGDITTISTSVDATGVVTSCYKLDSSKAPVNYATWGGYDGATGRLNMPKLDGKDGKVYLYGNGIFISLGGTHSKEKFSHAYIKCGYSNISAYLGKLAHYKDCSSGLSWFAKPSKYYGDYWTMESEYSDNGNVIKFKYNYPHNFNMGPNEEWASMDLGSDAFNNVAGKTVYFAANGQDTACWSHRGGEQIFPFGENDLMINKFVNNIYGTDVNGGNLDWSWERVSSGRCVREFI